VKISRREFIKRIGYTVVSVTVFDKLSTSLLTGSQVYCTPCSWQYGIMSPQPNRNIYGGFIIVKTPEKLKNLDCLLVIWSSLTTSTGYFYQVSLGFHPEWGWHISAGSTNPQLYCGLSCGPFAVNNQLFRPKPDSLYELGIRLIPMEGGVNEVWLYVVDWETKILYPIFKMSDPGYVATPIGGILEGFTKDESLLENIGGSNAFQIISANWLLTPWSSEIWPHGYVYGPTPQTCTPTQNGFSGYESVPPFIQIKPISKGSVIIGANVGGEQYQQGYQLW
jgi:hypothetical protein